MDSNKILELAKEILKGILELLIPMLEALAPIARISPEPARHTALGSFASVPFTEMFQGM